MSYYATINGYDLGDVGSNSGWFEFARWLNEIGGEQTRKLSEQGSADAQGVLREISKVVAKSGDIKTTKDNLITLIGKNKGTLIISDGVGEGDA